MIELQSSGQSKYLTEYERYLKPIDGPVHEIHTNSASQEPLPYQNIKLGRKNSNPNDFSTNNADEEKYYYIKWSIIQIAFMQAIKLPYKSKFYLILIFTHSKFLLLSKYVEYNLSIW